MATKKKPASRYHHGDLRAALLASAWGVVAKQGVEALSLRRVADALGVSHAAPAHHFADKDALLDALRAEAWRRFADALQQQEGEGLRAVGRAYVAFALEHPRPMNLMFRSGPRPTADIAQHANRAWGVLTGAVARELGARRAADPKELLAMATAAWAGVHGLAGLLTEVAMPDALPSSGKAGEALRERVLDVVLAGLRGA